MQSPLALEDLARLVGPSLTAEEARALADAYATLASGVAAFPAADLHAVEPPLRSVPGPPP